MFSLIIYTFDNYRTAFLCLFFDSLCPWTVRPKVVSATYNYFSIFPTTPNWISHKKSEPNRIAISFLILFVPPVVERFCPLNLLMGGAGSTSGLSCRSSHSEYSVVFLRNLRKYGLGSLRKIPTKDIPPIVPTSTSGELDLSLQPQPDLNQYQNFPDFSIHCLMKKQSSIELSSAKAFCIIISYVSQE